MNYLPFAVSFASIALLCAAWAWAACSGAKAEDERFNDRHL